MGYRLAIPFFSFFLKILTDGFLVGKTAWLATDFVTDLTDGFLIRNYLFFVFFQNIAGVLLLLDKIR